MKNTAELAVLGRIKFRVVPLWWNQLPWEPKVERRHVRLSVKILFIIIFMSYNKIKKKKRKKKIVWTFYSIHYLLISLQRDCMSVRWMRKQLVRGLFIPAKSEYLLNLFCKINKEKFWNSKQYLHISIIFINENFKKLWQSIRLENKCNQ